jgi:hypothetical protein
MNTFKKLWKEIEGELNSAIAEIATEMKDNADWTPSHDKRMAMIMDRLNTLKGRFVSVTTTTEKDGKETQKIKKIKKIITEGDPIIVTARVGLTINLGNYSSARVDAGIEYPCTKDKIADTYKEAWEIVQKEVQEESAVLTKDSKAEVKVEFTTKEVPEEKKEVAKDIDKELDAIKEKLGKIGE